MPRGRLEAPPTPRARMEDAWRKAPVASPRLPCGIMALQARQCDRRDMSGRARRPVPSWLAIGSARAGGWPASGRSRTVAYHHSGVAAWHT